MKEKRYIWPLTGEIKQISNPGMFGAVRKHDIHTGIDYYCNPGQKVVAIEDGIVVKIENFTGMKAMPPSKWWNDTQAVLIEGNSGVIVYGEIRPKASLKNGDKIEAGDEIGEVITVLKEDKGKPMTMLHLELYEKGSRETVIWNLNENKPNNLLNPEIFFENESNEK